MDERLRGKSTFICLSSSDEEEEEEDDDDDSEESNDSTFSSDDNDSSQEEENQSVDYEESCYNRVFALLKEGGDLEALNVKECKAYLRKHGLRIAGTKAVCIQRIVEHWRIKDGNGEALYPRSSFVVNCRGDVCKGDVVLFTQKVYEKFDKVTRHGRLLGKRTVAGKIIKESYGAAKQQHTFTVEVLWSKGIKKLPPLFPLLVKGRNLYKLKTFRQHWNNEAERVKVLAEKHKRGTAARLARAMKKAKKTWSGNGGAKHQKNFRHTRPSQMRKTTDRDKAKHVNLHGKATTQGHAKLINHQVPSLVRQVNLKRNAMSRTSKYSPKHQKFGHLTKDRGPTHQPYHNPPQNLYHSRTNYHHRLTPFHNSGYDMGSTSTMRLRPFRPYVDTSLMHSSQYQGLNQSNYTYDAYSKPSYSYASRNLNHFPGLLNVDGPSLRFPSETEAYGQRNNEYQSVPR